MLLTVVIPAFNEERTLGQLLQKIYAVPFGKSPYQMEIVLVDDGSTDKTEQVVSKFPLVRYIKQANQGKGAAVQRGIREAAGEYVLIQDADLEYQPSDYLGMLERLSPYEWRSVYGSRTRGQIKRRGWFPFPGKHPRQGFGPWIANLLISSCILLLYGTWISDPLTAYKIYPTHLIKEMKIDSKGFEADHEITAKLLKRGITILEVPIGYEPRSVEEGKKIRAVDGLIAILTLWKFRFN